MLKKSEYEWLYKCFSNLSSECVEMFEREARLVWWLLTQAGPLFSFFFIIGIGYSRAYWQPHSSAIARDVFTEGRLITRRLTIKRDLRLLFNNCSTSCFTQAMLSL